MVARRIGAAVVALATCWCAPPPLAADIFLLRSGGQIQGEWTNRDERRSAGQEVRTRSGIVVRVPAGDVEVRVPEAKANDEYERIAPAFGPTIDQQWRLAEWCRENRLPHRRQVHLEAILQIEPDHLPARRGLGYRQVGGQWQTREQHFRGQGYELYRGRWRLSQYIELQEEKAQRDQAQRDWLAKLRRWRADLATGRAPQAYQQFLEIDDPQAVPALQTLLARETDRRVKFVYLDVLQRIADGGAVQTLVATLLSDADDEMFYECADRLKRLPPPLYVKPLLDALGDSDNGRVNRAAYVLGKSGDATLASPLIDALVTVHRVRLQPAGDSTSFGSDGSVGIVRGQPAVVDVPVQNRRVLDALVELTGQNFDYDQRTWRRWYNLEKARQ